MKRQCDFLNMLLEFLCSQECRIWLRLALKPLAALAVLIVVVWLGTWLDARIAHAEIQQTACPVGLQEDGGLCYPQCEAGYTGIGPVCYKNCPADYTDDGASCRLNAHIFAKASYGRGGGSSLICAANQEGQGGLCYPKCIASHYGVGPVCWQRCPAGYADHGATCYRHLFDFFFKNTYGRGAGAAVSVCSAGLERNGALCYPKCAAGFYGVGPVCFQSCPLGYKDDGALCRKDAIITPKDSAGRGAGVVLNTVPEALDATFTTAKNTPVNLSFEHDDFDDDQGLPTIIVQQPTHGTYDGERYIPNQDFEGEDRLLWKVNDGKNDSNTAILTILVGNVGANVAPVALDRTVVVTEETPITIDVQCSDGDNDPLFYQLLQKPQHGDYQWVAPNHVIYTPTVDFVGTDAFSFRSHDGQAFSNISTITLTVGAVNDAPLVVTQPVTTTRNHNIAVILAATDVESDTIRYSLVNSPTHGSLSGEVPNLLYIPQPNFVGSDLFQFQASDDRGASTVATINITVQPTNTIPLAYNLLLTTTQESALAVNLQASDSDEEELSYTIVTSPTHGTLTGEGRDWVYMPATDFVGSDTFTYIADDGQSQSQSATATIHVTAAPTLASVVGIVYEDGNGNNQPDVTETGVGGLIVTLIPTNARTADNLTTMTDAVGSWRIDEAPFGQYTLRISASAGVEIATPVEMPVTLTERGVLQIGPAAVNVTSRSLFLPVVVK